MATRKSRLTMKCWTVRYVFDCFLLMTLGKKHVCTKYDIEMGLIIQGLKLHFVYIEMTHHQG